MGNSKKFSDIDIGVKSSRELPLSVLGDLKEAFEESNIPYSVDIVDFSTTTNSFKSVALQKTIALN